jgi:ankyrin repeat protein
MHGYKDLTELLLARGAKINEKNSEGDTPLNLAIYNHHATVAALLRAHGAKE